MFLSDEAISVLLHDARVLSFLSIFCATLDYSKEININHRISEFPVRKGLVPHQHLNPQRQWQWYI